MSEKDCIELAADHLRYALETLLRHQKSPNFNFAPYCMALEDLVFDLESELGDEE